MDIRESRHRVTLTDRIFPWVCAAGALLCLVELALQLVGTSICPTAGCKVVSERARFGDASILVIGAGTFLALAALSALSLRTGRAAYGRALDALLIASLASEGFFAGYQAFGVQTPCLFCLFVFVLVAILGVLRLWGGRPEAAAGFAAMAAVFSLQYLILPAGVTVSLPQEERLVLFYGKDCKHCMEIMKELEEKRIPVKHLLVGEYAAYLKQMGIEHVPTLLVNDPHQRFFLTGTGAIRRFLFPPTVPREALPEKTAAAAAGRPAAPAPVKAPAAPEPRSKPAATAPAEAPTPFAAPPPLPFDLSRPPASPLGTPSPESDDGMCKQDVDCD